MNKDELIEILQERSQESINDDLFGDSETPNTESKYLQKFKLRRRQDKERAILILLVIILLSSLIYLLYKQSKHDTLFSENEFIKKSTLIFSILPKETKDLYILRSEIDTYQEQLQSRDRAYIAQLEEKEEKLKKQVSILQEQTPKDFEELFNPDNQKVREANKKKLTKFDGRGCYDEKPGSFAINKKCETKISKYLKSISNKIIKIEIIPVIGKEDTKKIYEIGQTKEQKTYLVEGLARKRIIQGAKLVKKTLGKNVVVEYANFSVKSDKKRGVIVRTYFK